MRNIRIGIRGVMLVLAMALLAGLTSAQKGGRGGGGKGGGDKLPANPNVAFTLWNKSSLEIMDTVTGQSGKLARGGVFPAWSPDGSRLAYGVNVASRDGGYIAIRNTDGSGGETVVTSVDRGLSNLDWSRAPTPNGRHMLLFTEILGGPATLFAAELDGSDKIVLLQNAGNGVVRWSPGGDRILCGVEGQLRTYPVGLVGGRLAVTGTPTPIFEIPYLRSDCDWSNDGCWIVVNNGDLWRIDAANPSNVTRLTSTPSMGKNSVSFSADDSRVFFESDHRLYSIDAQQGGTPRLESGNLSIVYPQCRRD